MATLWLAGAWGSFAADAAVAPPAKPPETTTAAADEIVVLDGTNLWRYFPVADATHVRQADGSIIRTEVDWEGHPLKTGWNPANSSPLPPAGWAGLEFDDSAWPRVRLPQPAVPSVAFGGAMRGGIYEGWRHFDTVLACLRGKFEVKDSSKVKSLRLSLDYWGGVVVYVNGKEAARGNVRPGQTNLAATVADEYPEEAWTKPDGKPLEMWGDDKYKDRFALRNRRLNEVEIPSALLKPGANVLAIEVHAAPFHYKADWGGEAPQWRPAWPPIGLSSVRLAVSPAGAATPSVPRGIRVWNCEVYDTVSAADYGDSCETLRPIVIQAARNAVFSGRLMVSSDQPIKGLKATVSDLQSQAAGKLPASAVRVRYAVAVKEGKSWLPTGRFDGLFESMPAEIPLIESARAMTPGRAIAPLWFTVRVPRNVAAGLYEGTVTVSAEGLAATKVPLRLRVSDWVMPDPKDFRIQNFLTCAEEVHAKYYGVTNYSDRHFQLIGKSLALGAELNSRQVQVNLAIDFAAKGGTGESNPQSLVRWVKQADGSFRHDFTIFDEYLEMVAQSVGTPRTLQLNCWGSPHSDEHGTHGEFHPVSVLDPATGLLTRTNPPPFAAEECYRFWKPVFDGVLQRIKARGWQSETTLGYISQVAVPPPTLVSMAHRLWPEGEWSWASHGARLGTFQSLASDLQMTIRHAASPFVNGNPGVPPLWAEDKPRRNTFSNIGRGTLPDNSPLWYYRRWIEFFAMSKGLDGAGEWGLDLFPLPRPAGGYVKPACGRGTNWAGWDGATAALLYPGPDGAVATERYEAFREGIELCEAVLFVQTALARKQITGDLAQRADRYLNPDSGERVRCLCQRPLIVRHRMQADEDAKLLDLAGEVARELAGKK